MLDLEELKRLALQAKGRWRASSTRLLRDGEEMGRIDDPAAAHVFAAFMNHATELYSELVRLNKENRQLRHELRYALYDHPKYSPGRARKCAKQSR